MKWKLSSLRQAFGHVQRQAVFADLMLSRTQIAFKAVDSQCSFFGVINYEGSIRVNVSRLPQAPNIINIKVFFNVPGIRDIVFHFAIRYLFENNRLMGRGMHSTNSTLMMV